MPRESRLDAADLSAAGGAPSRHGTGRRTLLLAVWALLLAAVFAVALRSAEDGPAAADARVARRSATVAP